MLLQRYRPRFLRPRGSVPSRETNPSCAGSQSGAMLLRTLCSATGFALFALSAVADEPAANTAIRSMVRAHLRERIMARLPAKPAATHSVPAEAAADDAVKLAPFIVKELRYPKNAEVDAGMHNEKALESRALYKKDLTKKVRLETVLPPGAGSGGGFSLPLLRISW